MATTTTTTHAKKPATNAEKAPKSTSSFSSSSSSTPSLGQSSGLAGGVLASVDPVTLHRLRLALLTSSQHASGARSEQRIFAQCDDGDPLGGLSLATTAAATTTMGRNYATSGGG